MLAKGSNLQDENELSEFSQFLHEYGGLDFTKVKFRPGANFSTEFGMDSTFNALRFHPAIDRGSATREIYAPFNLAYIEIDVSGMWIWGIQLKLQTAYGFEVRIAHIEDISDELMDIIKKKSPVKAGTFLCLAGKAGKSTGIHTHVEIVSHGEKASFLEELLFLKYIGVEKVNYNLNDIVRYIEDKNLSENPTEAYARESKKKRISFLNKYLCRRIDYYDNKRCTFYSSQALFGM